MNEMQAAIADAFRSWSGTWQNEDPVIQEHNTWCTAHNEGQWCCLDEGHQLFDALCAHVADRLRATAKT